MAKKKKAEGVEEAQKIASIEDKLSEEFGDGVFVSGAYVTEQPQTIIPVGPQLDIMLNGGIPFGSFFIPTGPPKVGKTTTSLDIAASALAMPTKFDNPRHIFYSKVEGRLQPRDLLGIHHLASRIGTDVTVIQSRRGKILYAEDYLDINEQLMNEKPGCIFIMDSMSQLCSKSRKEKDWQEDKGYRDNVPTFLSNFCKRICQVIPINESLFIGITHQIANTGFGFSSWSEASGNKVQYQVDVKLKATHNQPLKSGDSKIGLEVFWECFSSPLQNGSCIEKTSSKFRFGWGVDKHMELVNTCADMRLITKGGSWYTIKGDDGSDIKVQGLDNARQVLIENPETTARLYYELREMWGFPTVKIEDLKLCL